MPPMFTVSTQCLLHYSDEGYGAAQTWTITLAHFAKSKILSGIHHQIVMQIANCSLTFFVFLKSAELVSELETLTKRPSKPLGHSCLFTQLPSISESKAVTRIKLMIMVFEYTTGREHSWLLRSTEKNFLTEKDFFRKTRVQGSPPPSPRAS